MNNTNSISLNDALSKSDYTEFMKNKVKEFLIENYRSYNNKSSTYLTKSFNKNIIVIKFDLHVKYKTIEYIITILIYMPITFPNELRIYFEYNQNFIIDSYYQEQKIIDETTAELYYEKIIHFTPLKQPLSQLINALTNKFVEKFPLFKAKKKPEFYGPCHLDENSTKIDIKPDDLKESENLIEARKKMKDIILISLEEKLFEIQSTQSKLESIKTEINTNIINDYSKTKVNELEEMNVNLIKIKSKLEEDVNNLKYKEKKGILEKCDEIVKIKNKEKFKFTVIKKDLEDFLRCIKKSFERNLITFRQSVDETRQISKELFIATYLAEKNI